MTKAVLTKILGNETKSWLKPLLAFALTGTCLHLIACAVPSVGVFLDKPIPTGSLSELIAYASGAIFVASLFMFGALAIYLNFRFARHLRAEQQAKAMAKEIIERISAKGNASSQTSRHPAKLMH
jgi:TRAP-type C4-dicarboxylate transport system permease small subunit